MTQQIVAVDWFRVLGDLAQRDRPMPAVSKQTGIGLTTLYDYRDGNQPIHWRGELLLELWCAVCSKTRQDVPMATVVLAPRVVQPKPTVQEDMPAAFGLETWARRPLLDRLKALK